MPPSESLASPRLWLAFSTMLLVGGIANAFPVLLPALLAEFGGARAAAAAAISIFWLGSAIFVPVAGRLIDRGDPRLVIGAGLLAAALGTAGAALAPTLPVFAIVLGVGGGIGAGLTGFVAQAAVIAETYRARRGFATGIAFSGAMVGYALATPAHWAITAVGWRWTLVAWAAALVLLIPLVLRHYPPRLGDRAVAGAVDRRGTGDVVHSVPFWALAVVFTAPPLAGYLLTLHHQLYFASRGFTPGDAAWMLLAGGILSTAGRALAGLLADRLGAAAAGIVSWVLSLSGALALIAFEIVRAPALAYLYLFCVFLPMGSRATIVSVLALRISPPGRYGLAAVCYAVPRRSAMTRLVALVLVLAATLAPRPVRAAELPIFDAHVHYSHDAWDVVPPKDVVALLHQAGVKRALLSSSNDDGTQKLLSEAPDLIVPELRPYRKRGELSTWMRDETVIAYLEERLAKYRYVGIGEFHLYGADADLPVPRKMVALARRHTLILHAHSDADAVERLFRQDPQARILWAHAGFESPARVREMLRTYKTLWADLAFRTDHAPGGRLAPEWREAFLEFPDRFMVGTDTFTPERWHYVPEHARWSRGWLAELPRDVAERIAYRNGDALLGAAWAKAKSK